MQGRRHKFEGGGGRCIGRWGGVNTVKILKFEKGGGACPPAPIVALPLVVGGGGG